jgi:hypothetical protein
MSSVHSFFKMSLSRKFWTNFLSTFFFKKDWTYVCNSYIHMWTPRFYEFSAFWKKSLLRHKMTGQQNAFFTVHSYLYSYQTNFLLFGMSMRTVLLLLVWDGYYPHSFVLGNENPYLGMKFHTWVWKSMTGYENPCLGMKIHTWSPILRSLVTTQLIAYCVFRIKIIFPSCKIALANYNAS